MIHAAIADDGGDHLPRDKPRPQNLRDCARAVEHGAFDAAAGRTAVDDQRNIAVKIVENVLRRDGRNVFGAVCARRGNGYVYRPQKRLRSGRRRHAHRNRGQPARDERAHLPFGRVDHRQRTGQKRLAERLGIGRNFRKCGNIVIGMYVRNERVIRRTAFEREDLPDGFVVAGVRAETVHRLRMEGDDLPRLNQLFRIGERPFVGRQNERLHSGIPVSSP